MKKINLLVIFGGHSTEHEVSKASAQTVFENLDKNKYNIIPLYITKSGRWLLYDGDITSVLSAPLEKFGTQAVLSPDRDDKCLLRIAAGKVKRIPIDVIFPVLHGINGEDGTIQGLFEMAGVSYVGSGVLSSALCMDKVFTNLVTASANIPHTKYVTLCSSDIENHENIEEIVKLIKSEIGYPCFVKPANTGSSIGISKAKSKKSLINALITASIHDKKVIVEKAIVGREFEIAILENDDIAVPLIVSLVGEIVTDAEFYDYESKYNSKKSRTIIPPDLPENICEEMKKMAVKVFKSCECFGMARVDFFVENKTNRVIFNEINTIPGFTQISMYPKLLNDSGLKTSEIIDKLIEIGLNREC